MSELTMATGFSAKNVTRRFLPDLLAVIASFIAAGIFIGLMGFNVLDAYETILFPLVGTQIDEPHLLHLAPAGCPKFRGIKVGKRILERTSNTKRTMSVSLP